MTRSEPLTRYVGQAERTLQALLQTQLQTADISFPEWAVLTFLNGTGTLTRAQLAEAINKGRVIESEATDDLVDAMSGRGLIEESQARLAMTETGREVYRRLRSKVMMITATLESEIPEEDLAATRRTLKIVSERAEDILTAERS